MSTPENWPFQVMTTDLTVAYDYDSSGNLIYQGWVQPGTAKSDTGWRIVHQLFNSSNKVTDVVWPNASTAFNFVWNLRTTYDYGTGAATIYTAIILTSPNTTRWAITILPVTGNLVTTPAASGPSGAYDVGSLVLQDSGGIFWGVSVSNTGNLITTTGGSPAGALTSIPVTDATLHTWIVTASTTGDLITT